VVWVRSKGRFTKVKWRGMYARLGERRLVKVKVKLRLRGERRYKPPPPYHSIRQLSHLVKHITLNTFLAILFWISYSITLPSATSPPEILARLNAPGSAAFS
jgi:hypothetical protein